MAERRNFQATGALSYAFPAGLLLIPLFLKRGWLGALVVALSLAGISWSSAQLLTPMGDPEFLDQFRALIEKAAVMFQGSETGGMEGLSAEESRIISIYFLSATMMTVGLFMSVPGLVDVVRRSAGREPSPSFMPVFGRAEWSAVLATLAVMGATLGILLFIGAPAMALVVFAMGAMGDSAAYGFLIILPLYFLIIWFNLRASLIAPHAAVQERVAFGEGFRLLRGRVWKFLLTIIVMSIAFGLISLATSALSLSALSFGFPAITFAIEGFETFYGLIVYAAFNGYLVGDLLGPAPNAEASGGANDLESALDASQPWSEMATFGDGARGQMLRRDPSAVRRRFD